MIPDVLPKLLIEIRDDAAVDAIVDGRVRGFEPEPDAVDDDGVVTRQGDVRGPGAYVAFVVLVQSTSPRHPRVPIQFTRTIARCYGRNPREAAELRWAVSNAIHNTGPRVHSNDLGIYNSHDETGGEQEADPVTKQPYQTVVITAPATTQAVA